MRSETSTKSTWLIVIIVFVLSVISFTIEYNHSWIETLTVNRIEMQQHVSGSDGSTSTYYKYVAMTNKGMRYIGFDGKLGSSGQVCQLEEGNTYEVEVRGFDFPLADFYPSITKVIRKL